MLRFCTMILSFKNEYVFLHVPKTGGSSIGASLAKFLGPDCIMVGEWVDALAAGVPYNQRVFKELLSPEGLVFVEKSLRRALEAGYSRDYPVLDYAFRQTMALRFGSSSSHMTWDTVRNFAPEEWARFFTFCFVRNPFTHAVSWWRWRTTNTQGGVGNKGTPIRPEGQSSAAVSFQAFLELLSDPELPDPDLLRPSNMDTKISGWKIYANAEEPVVDFVGRFENLAKDLVFIHHELGIPIDETTIPKAKSSKGGSPAISDLYTVRSRLLVERLWSRELNYFNYSFPS